MEHVTPLLAQHERSGAVLGDYFGCRVPARFSSPEREYAFAMNSVALIDTNYQCWAWLDGADRVRFLNAITTNDVKSLQSGQGVTGLLLNPQGHILAEITTLALDERLLLRSHAIEKQRMLDTLEKFIIMDDASLVDMTEELGSVAIEGPLAPQVIQEFAGIAIESAADCTHWEKQIEGVSCRIVRRSHFGSPGAEIVIERDRLDALWNYLGSKAREVRGGRVGYEALNTLRLEAGVPWFGCDFDDKVIPHEAGLEQSHISYTKGCYTGQEIVERVRSRGQVNRRLTRVKFSTPEPPPAGTKLFAGEKEVGHVTSAAQSPQMNCPIGFAYLRREAGNSGNEVGFPGGTAKVL